MSALINRLDEADEADEADEGGLRAALAAPADASERRFEGPAALDDAAEPGFVASLTPRVEAGADLDRVNEADDTALIKAVRHEKLELTRAPLAHEADPGAPKTLGSRPLNDLAELNAGVSLQMARSFAPDGVEVTGAAQESPLERAAQGTRRALLESGAKADAEHARRITAGQHAAAKSSLAWVGILLASGATLSHPNGRDLRAIHPAGGCSHADLVALLSARPTAVAPGLLSAPRGRPARASSRRRSPAAPTRGRAPTRAGSKETGDDARGRR